MEAKQPESKGLRTSQGTGAQAEAFLETELDDFTRLVGPAARGEAQAQYLLARCYAKGLGGAEKSEQAAFQWYTAAAQQEHPKAQYKLGRCLSEGQGVRRNRREALQWYLKAAHHRHCKPRAQFRVALAYDFGYGVEADKQEAVRWYRAAAEGGCRGAQNNLGMCLARGDGVAKDHEEAFQWFQAAAKQGSASAQYNLALSYQRGEGVEVQWKEAVRWHRAAMEQGHAKAKYELAKCLLKGKGTKGDPEQALLFLRELAKTGFQPAARKLCSLVAQIGHQANDDGILELAAKWYSRFLRSFDSVTRAHPPFPKHTRLSHCGWKAIFWYFKARRVGDASAQFNLALAFSKGRDYFSTADHEEAGKWFLAAAKQHHAHAQYFTARRLAAKGKKEEAMEWFLASARQGLPQAQFRVGLHLCEATSNKEEEQGVEYCKQAAKARDPAASLWMAKHWRSKAQFVKARKCLDRLQEATPLAAEEVRLEGEMVLREMNKNKEGMPVRSLLEASKMAVAKQVMQNWERNMEKMKSSMPTELWQELEPFLPVLTTEEEEEEEDDDDDDDKDEDEDKDKEEEDEEDEEEERKEEDLQKVYEEEKNTKIDSTNDEAEIERVALYSTLFKHDWVNLFLHAFRSAHFGIHCAGCGASPIEGVRYKCGHCSSFDLCSGCEAETTHDERHVFLKIKRPFYETFSGPLLPNFH
ncbi:TATA-box binding protein associated factor 7 like [Balamuthia mandrillaris]